jgi:predicted amidohydrolase YtcJ
VNYIFRNGPVFVGNAARSWARAVAVIDGKIAAVGSDDDVRDTVPPGAIEIDLDGRLLTAGFQDAHVHPMMGGLARMQCNLEEVRSLDAALAVITDYADRTPEGWLLGGGWNYYWFDGGNPPAALLDAITDRPVYLGGADGHSGWANSAALALAGITATTPDPVDGRIERLPNGTPQGTLHEGAMNLMERVAPQPGPAEVCQALLEGQRFLISLGITAWQDAWVTEPLHGAYKSLAESGDLKATVRGALWWDRERGIDQFEEHLQYSTEGVGRYDPRTVKLIGEP